MDTAKTIEISIDELMRDFQPRFMNEYKAEVWQKIANLYPDKSFAPNGKPIIVSQYRANLTDLKIEDVSNTEILSVSHFFDYAKSDNRTKLWYLNFADPNLFFGYGTSLFAQDEIQCLEHPLLGAVREYLLGNPECGVSTLTITNDEATPILIENVPYMVNVNTIMEVDGVPYSIYGSNFGMTEYRHPEILDLCIRLRAEFTESNILVMCAPYPESGRYRRETIDYLVRCAITSFAAASERSPEQDVEIHTGRWGAGAFGGNEEIALLVQIIAARLTGIKRVVFHAVTAKMLDNAKHLAEEILKDCIGKSLNEVAKRIDDLGYMWGYSDGN